MYFGYTYWENGKYLIHWIDLTDYIVVFAYFQYENLFQVLYMNQCTVHALIQSLQSELQDDTIDGTGIFLMHDN